MKNKTITNTEFNFPKQQNVYHGKVRDVYSVGNDLLVMIATDRLSAFDVVMPKGIPYKGQILNQIASLFMKMTEDIVPNWLIASPDPNVSIGKVCEPFKVEMVVRGYLAGHAAREYNNGVRQLCGVQLPEGLQENDKLPEIIITPSTKEALGQHDVDISREEIIARGIVAEQDYILLENYSKALFKRGSEIAKDRGLILVDTKYEFGRAQNGEIVLIDEIHTPDSSRYFYAEGYEERQIKRQEQKQLSKEFVRQWLIGNGFKGLEGQVIPEMTDEYIEEVSNRYIELYEHITGQEFVKAEVEDIALRIEKNVLNFLRNKI